MMHTPFGDIVLSVDGVEIDYVPNQLESHDNIFPDLSARYSIVVPYRKSDGIKRISCWLRKFQNVDFEASSDAGERLEEMAFYSDTTKMAIGAFGDFGYSDEDSFILTDHAKSYGFDYIGAYIENGVEYHICEETAEQASIFGISWITPYIGEDGPDDNDYQTWYGSDPALMCNKPEFYSIRSIAESRNLAVLTVNDVNQDHPAKNVSLFKDCIKTR
jgi:hypothetical protein